MNRLTLPNYLLLLVSVGLLFMSSNCLAASNPGLEKLKDPTPQEKELMQAAIVGDIDTVKQLLD